ncbi:Tip elongation aberrant protein Tea4 [Psilocybe cubensis]|uniref:Tip elongation aberrant protein Tea4 n=2 Tax=Psilocybe cubensis TaxID=181762 RepID=A0ACB8H5T9_PSICU|nr:Tip elongation aberrant protein Tea4 [Psilocybe cubensis]KAH9483226.1 Tip elongation aberrant protein Tea4 [Psilocybe cubensis]
MSVDPRRPTRQDTFDLRDQIHADDSQNLHAHADAALNYGTDDEEHSVLEDDSEVDEGDEMFEEDVSSTLSIPNESIDFDMVYALHSFAATVEGQANVVKGDSLYLMDDNNSYWWLVRVLKTQEVGYIPAENIETPFERLARLNKHRNIELALPTQAEQVEIGIGDRRNNVQFRSDTNSPTGGGRDNNANNRRSIRFNSIRYHHRFIPGLKEGEVEDEDDEWDTDGFEEEDLEVVQDQMEEDEFASMSMDVDDGMHWDDSTAEDVQLNLPSGAGGGAPIPDALMPGSMREYQEQQRLRAQQQEQLQLQEEQLVRQKMQQQMQLQQQQQQQQQQQAMAQQQAAQQAALAQQAAQQAQQQQRQMDSNAASAQGPRRIDPAEVTETRKMTATPTIARDSEDGRTGQYLPSIVVEEERSRRLRDDESSLLSDESSKKKSKPKEKMAPPVSSATYNKQQAQQQAQQQNGSKLRKEPSIKSEKTDTEDEGKDKKKKGGVFGGLFGRKNKDKPKDKSPSIASVESNEFSGRASSESSRSSQRPSASDGGISPTTSAAQQQQQAISLRNTVADMRAGSNQATPSTPERSNTPQVSEHVNQLRQRDQQQYTLYKEYLNRSPSSPPEAQPSYGLQSASAVMLSSPSSSSALGPPTTRPRPGSLILTSPSAIDGQANLSVIRVFAGENLQTEATFKTVLLNPSTTSTDLVRQAIQRFRLPSGEDVDDYYLTVKQVEGGASTVLQPVEHPLVVFETLLESTELPKVKRSSVGSISSISSNLSMHPAIKKLPMNDFTDDSAVKFYLNRKGDHPLDDILNGEDGDETLTSPDRSQADSDLPHSGSKSQFLTVSTVGGANVAPERFTSPATRFAMQLVIYAEDLPNDMAFHPQTEAIVFKNTLTDPNAPVLVSPNLRRKVFMFPKNVTVAEVTEISLERFGIQDGVIDGGDEVEDKTTKRRSGVRVRYGLMISIDGQERELSPSSKVIDAFPRPPQFKAPNSQNSVSKRRSLDSTQLLGSIDDIRQDDPVFVLRRSTSYRNSTSRKRFSAPLDEIALQHLHRESTSSFNSEAVAQLEEKDREREGGKLKQPSRQEIIAAQRAATRATQKAIVSASTNSVRGMDVLLPGNAVLRSARYDTGDRMRYSYVEPDGETYDVSDIIEEEWREMHNGGGGGGNNNKNDLLEGVFIRNKDGIGEKLDRVLHKIRKGKGRDRGSRDYASLSSVSADSRPLSTLSATLSTSEYSVDDGENPSRSVTPGSAALAGKMNMEKREPTEQESLARSTPVANASPEQQRAASRPGTTTPTGVRTSPTPTANINANNRRNPSIASIMSVNSGGRSTPVQSQSSLSRVEEENSKSRSTPSSTRSQQQQRRIVIPKDDFGLTQMMSIIEYKASVPSKPTPRPHPVDELLFGTPLDLQALHPSVRDIYADGFKHLEEIDKVLDSYIGRSVVGAF